MTKIFNKTKQVRSSITVPLLFVLTFSILLVGQYTSKTGALLLNNGETSIALIYIAIGYGCLVFRGLIWMVILKYVRLSVAYPIQSFSFILITFLGVIVFNDILSMGKILGMVLIVCGVIVISLSK